MNDYQNYYSVIFCLVGSSKNIDILQMTSTTLKKEIKGVYYKASVFSLRWWNINSKRMVKSKICIF